MKKLITILLTLSLTILVCACGKENADVVNTDAVNTETVETEEISQSETVYDIQGIWTQVNSDTDSYFVLELKADGSGSLMTEPEDFGTPLNYEFEGTSIMTHMGSTDDNTPMEYLPDSDQIQYNDIFFARGEVTK